MRDAYCIGVHTVLIFAQYMPYMCILHFRFSGIYTDKMINKMVDDIGEIDENDGEAYSEMLSLVTEEVDAEKLKEAAARRAEKQLELPTSTEQVKG